ncbi:MAG: hypothetical protein C4343_05565, partial [Chloroflexota bacterium]
PKIVRTADLSVEVRDFDQAWRAANAVAAALDPALVRSVALAVDVELGGTLTSGETVADWRRVWGRPPNLEVAVEASVGVFFDRFIERVGDLARRVGV